MARKITLTVSVIMLTAISSAAVAGTAKILRHWPAVSGSEKTMRRLNSFDSAASTMAAEPRAHRYHGGPKSND